MTIIPDTIVRDEGTVVLFEGFVSDVGVSPFYTGQRIRFACDHRMAQAIASALDAGEYVETIVAEWQVM